ncbi:MAG: hypothetical protein U0527_17010, partial [Candidatus Eisenbacteria bacterium]
RNQATIGDQRSVRPWVLLSIAVALGLGSARPTLAGPNSDGSLIVHANTSLTYTFDRNWAGFSDISRCERAITDVAEGQKTIWFIIAAFPSYVSPKIKAMNFGIEFDSQVTIEAQGRCAGDGELSTETWPNSGAGTAIWWADGSIERDRVFEVYWFAGYGYYGNQFAVVPHPTQGGAFADDETPAEIDAVAGYGILGFGVAGANPCLDFLPNGACCDPQGRCTITIKSLCEERGRTYFGDYTSCDPGKCLGPCCIDDQCFADYTQVSCERERGEFKNMGGDCRRTACIPTRTHWGTMKRVFREY